MSDHPPHDFIPRRLVRHAAPGEDDRSVKIEPFLDQAILRRLLRYSRRTGKFTWRKRSDVRNCWNTRYAGREAGSSWTPGNITYRVIRIFDYPFLAHRLAWLYVEGRWPTDGIDHRDLDGENNRWRNLRPATKFQNGANRGPNSNNKTGFKGVSVRAGRFRATIQVNGKWRSLGVFDSAQEASAAYRAAAIRLAGRFARVA